MAAGNGYVVAGHQPTAYVIIGYPFTLTVFYWLGGLGPHNLYPKLANVLYSMGILIGTFCLGRRLFSDRIARLALVLMVFAPNQIAYNSLLANEALSGLFITFSLVLAFTPSRNRFTGVWLGLLVGAGSYVKPQCIGFFPFIFLCLWATDRDWRRPLVVTIIAGIVCMTLLMPWLVRNRIVFGEWVLANNGPWSFLVGNNPGATGQHYRSEIVNKLYPEILAGGQREVRCAAEAKRIAKDYIRTHPAEFLLLGVKKLNYFYHHDVDGIWHVLNGVEPKVSRSTWNFWTRLGHLYYAGLMLSTIGYFIQVFRTRRFFSPPNLLLLFVFYFSLLAFVYHAMPRYHYPLIPIFSVFAASFLATLCCGSTNKEQGTPGTGINSPTS